MDNRPHNWLDSRLHNRSTLQCGRGSSQRIVRAVDAACRALGMGCVLAISAIFVVAAAGLSACAGGAQATATQAMATADPSRQSLAEYDLAKDLFVARGRAREALEHALRAVELDETHAEAAHLVALIYLYYCAASEMECRLGEAEHYASLAVKANPKYREAINTLGVVYVHQKRYDDAVKVLVPLANDILYATPEIAWGNLGWAYLLKGDLDKAISSLQRVLALQPDFCVGAYRLALAYEKRGDLEAAHQTVTRALQTDRPECRSFQDAFHARARIAMRRGDRDRAREDLQRCRDLNATNATGRECEVTLAKLK